MEKTKNKYVKNKYRVKVSRPKNSEGGKCCDENEHDKELQQKVTNLWRMLRQDL